MRKSIKLTWSAIALGAAVMLLLTTPMAQESKPDAAKQAEAEMQEMLGTVPLMMETYPEHMRAAAWEWFKTTMSPDAAIPPKYSQLISLAVASQIPCAYCVYAHTTMAKAEGATDAEIMEAVAAAAETRHWSTVLNGADVPLDKFKSQWDGILKHLESQKMAGK